MTEKLFENLVDLESRARLPKPAILAVTFLTAVNIILRYLKVLLSEKINSYAMRDNPHPSLKV